MGAGGEANPLIPFGEAFAASFRVTPACSAWDEITDPVIFDLSEPRHPCDGKVNAVADISIRLTEGLHDLRIEESLAPTREALSSAFAAGSTSLLTTFNSMREGVNNRIESERQRRAAVAGAAPPSQPLLSPNAAATPAAAPAVSPIGGAFASVGSFFGSRFAKTPPPPPNSFTPKGLRPMSLKASPASSRRNSTKTASSGNGSPPKAGAL
jgi:hypothetical protein